MIRKSFFISILLQVLFLFTAVHAEDPIDSLTYAVFPYLPDVGYYEEIIESRWAEMEPDISLTRADWNCYKDGAPEGIDVIMFDAVKREKIIDSGWIQPIDPNAVQESEDIFPFALEGITVDDRLYGIPVFLCGNFLIYDEDCEALDTAEHITDLADMSEILVMNSEDSGNRKQYIMEVLADTLGEANPSADLSDERAEAGIQLLDRLAIDGHKKDDDPQVTMAYDSGIGQGYIGFSESMRLLTDRKDKTRIKSVSFSDQDNISRLYVDVAAVVAGVEGERYEKRLKLMNVMAEAEVLTTLSVQEGAPQYLMLARKSPYADLAGQFPLYEQMEKLASEEGNHTILAP